MKNIQFKVKFLFALLLIIILGCTRKDNEKGWSTYRHDSARTGVTTEELPSNLSLNWTYIPSHAPKPVWSLPAEEMPRMHFDNTYYVSAVNGLIYFGSSVDNKVYALDISTGKEKWTFFTEGPVRFSPMVYNNRVYFGSDDGYVYCLKAKSGILVWRYCPGPKDNKVLGSGRMVSLWPVRTSVLVEDETVYFGAGVFPYDGLYVCALNARNGSVIWKNDNLDDDVFDLQYGGVSPQSYLIASEDHLFVPSGRAMPAVFDKTGGSFLFYLSPSGKQGGTWGMINQGTLVAGVDRSGIPTKVSFDTEKGERIGDLFASFTGIDMVGTGDHSYVVTENGVYAIDRVRYPLIQEEIDSLRKLQNDLIRSFRSMDYTDVSNNSLFNENLDKVTGKLDSLTSKEEKLKSAASKWFFPQKHLHSIIYAGGQVIVGGEGIVLGLNSETGEEYWRSEVKGTAYGLAVSRQSLLVSTDKGPIYCFNGKNPNPNEAGETLNSKPFITDSPYTTNSKVYEKAASTILNRTSVNKGYCLVVDCGEGQLAYELAKTSDLYIIGIENNLRKVRKAKEKLDKAGLYGEKVIVENWSINSLPEYFADLIVSGGVLNSGQINLTPDEIFRVLKPGGGIACFGQPAVESYSPKQMDLQKLTDEWAPFNIKEPGIISEEGNWIMFTRMHLAGVGGWTHQYGNPANTSCSDDKLVMAPFSTLWYGPPGPQLIPERHARASSPVAFDGKLIVEGEDVIMAYNAYNGTLLWEREIKGANRVRVDADGGNMAINRYGLFVAVNDHCLQLDIETGETVQTFRLPPAWKEKPRRWGYIAVKDNILFGSAAMPLKQEYAQIMDNIIEENGSWKEREELTLSDVLIAEYYKYTVSENAEKVDQAFQRDGTKWRTIADFPDWNPGINGLNSSSDKIMASDGIFAVNIETGNILWTHQGKKIAQITISVGDSAIYFAENTVTSAQRLTTLKEKQKNIQKGIWEKFYIELGINEADIRIIYSLDILSGKKKWEKVMDLSGCGDDLTASGYHNGVLLFFGSYGLHDKWRFPAGELKWHRITAVSSENGDLIWSRPLNYMVRPLVIKDEIIIEPRKCDLYTGEIKTRIHPITGKQVPWEFYRPGHTCAATSSTENCLFYRSYNSAYYDLKEDKGINYYGAIRPGCWINMIPGNGLVLFPEASSGCTCSFPLRTSVVLKPENREEVEDWSLYISNAPITPVKHLAINLGAPGDMKDRNGTIWFGYPRPDMELGIKLDLNEEILNGMGYYSYDSKGVDIEGTDYSWLFTNGCVGFLTCQIPLIDNLFGEEAGIFTIRLGFAAPSTNRKFDIKIQDNIVMENLNVLKEAGAVNNIVIKEFKGIHVVNNLSLELVPEITDSKVNQAPVISFIEVIREDTLRKSEVAEENRIIYASEAKKMLENAGKEYDEKDFENALNTYHMVLKGSAIKEFKMQALEGMERIASYKSLPVIKKYCQKLDPIMWDYKEPNQELVDAADRVYTAIVSNLANEE